MKNILYQLERVVLFRMIVICIVASIILFPKSIMAQDEKNRIEDKSRAIRLGLIEFSIEQKVSDNKSVIARISTSLFTGQVNRNRATESGITIWPNFTLEPRIYSWKNKRIAEGKRVDYFSGSYIGLPLILGLTQWPRYSVAPVIGFQRTIARKGYFDAQIGYGLNRGPNVNQFQFLGRVALGFILN
ncbi:MAG: hypothetical protein AAFY45_34965 [Bacteroidota bacterium]